MYLSNFSPDAVVRYVLIMSVLYCLENFWFQERATLVFR